MVRVVWGPAKLLLLQITSSSALNLPDLSTLQANTIYFLPIDGAVCGVGTQMYYGIITPAVMPPASPQKFWVESMGGAICFDKDSCTDEEFSVWLDLVTVVFRYAKGAIQGMGVTAQQYLNLLISGAPIPMDQFRALGAAYFPNNAGGPLAGQVGFYFPSCSGDAGLGNYEVNYSSDLTVRHAGGAGFRTLLQAMKVKYSPMTRLTLIGASGTAVSRVAWAPAVADMFPQTEILVVADSAMHVLPATKAFQFFWNDVQWSPNPNGKHDLARLYNSDLTSLPTFDWQSASAISDMLRHYNGRIKLLYLGCLHHKVIVGDRTMLTKFSNMNPQATEDSSKKEIEDETWTFLQNLKRDAPAGSAFSYISTGDCHHQTRNGWAPKIDANDWGPENFTEAFLLGSPSGSQHRWCCDAENFVPKGQKETASSADTKIPSLVALALTLATQML